MDALFRLPNNDLSAALQKDKLFKEVEQQWNTVSSEEGNSRRKVDYEIYKSIVYNLEVRKVFLDPKLSLVKFSSIVGTVATRGYYVDYQWYLKRRGNSGFIPYFV